MQTVFVSLFCIFINMKPWNASNSSVFVVGLLLIMQISKLFNWKATPTLAFNEFLRIFVISENSIKFANFFCWGNEFSIYALTGDDRVMAVIWRHFAQSGSFRSQLYVKLKS